MQVQVDWWLKINNVQPRKSTKFVRLLFWTTKISCQSKIRFRTQRSMPFITVYIQFISRRRTRTILVYATQRTNRTFHSSNNIRVRFFITWVTNRRIYVTAKQWPRCSIDARTGGGDIRLSFGIVNRLYTKIQIFGSLAVGRRRELNLSVGEVLW